MYNSLIFFSRTSDKSIQFLLSKHEFDAFKNEFSWCIGPEGYIINSEDVLSEQMLDLIINLPEICDDYDVSQYDISYYSGIFFFSVKDYVANFRPIEPGVCNANQEQIVPYKGRPTFMVDEDFRLEWFHEYGIFKKTILKTSKSYYIHPVTNNFLFKDLGDYKFFIDKHRKYMEELKKEHWDERLFIRVINVYGKESSKLKYRIINDEFLSSGLNYELDMFKDDILYLRSYKINEELADFILDMTSLSIEFDFTKNEYYLETLAADNFIYSYNEFIKDLSIDK